MSDLSLAAHKAVDEAKTLTTAALRQIASAMDATRAQRDQCPPGPLRTELTTRLSSLIMARECLTLGHTNLVCLHVGGIGLDEATTA